MYVVGPYDSKAIVCPLCLCGCSESMCKSAPVYVLCVYVVIRAGVCLSATCVASFPVNHFVVSPLGVLCIRRRREKPPRGIHQNEFD